MLVPVQPVAARLPSGHAILEMRNILTIARGTGSLRRCWLPPAMGLGQG